MAAECQASGEPDARLSANWYRPADRKCHWKCQGNHTREGTPSVLALQIVRRVHCGAARRRGQRHDRRDPGKLTRTKRSRVAYRPPDRITLPDRLVSSTATIAPSLHDASPILHRNAPHPTLHAALFPNARFHDFWAIYKGDTWASRRAEGFELSPSIKPRRERPRRDSQAHHQERLSHRSAIGPAGPGRRRRAQAGDVERAQRTDRAVARAVDGGDGLDEKMIHVDLGTNPPGRALDEHADAISFLSPSSRHGKSRREFVTTLAISETAPRNFTALCGTRTRQSPFTRSAARKLG